MTYQLLKKGLEVELYAGTETGEILPLSIKIKKYFSKFSQEPDQRNFEYITKPTTNYTELFKEIIKPRLKIRKFLKKYGNYILIPGSTISLPFKKDFYYSQPGDPYHKYILKTYKTKVITTSLHINIGIDNYETLFKLLCALRLDVPLFLALSTSSCFHDGRVTNFYSYRWHSFPKTPKFVPFFTNHNEFVNWTNEQLALKKMLNVRHLWTSIRPNGPNRPYDLNRIEIRICDLVTNTKHAIAIVALIESITQKYLQEDNWPKQINKSQLELNKLVKVLQEQEELVAKGGLNAKIWNWRSDSKEEAYKIIETLYKDLESTAKKINVLNHLKPVLNILEEGTETTHFLKMYNKTKSISKTIQHFIQQFNIIDLQHAHMLKIKS